MTENYSDSLFEWNLDTVDDGLYFLPGKNGLDCGSTNLQDTLYPFLENEEVSNEDSKFQNLPSEDADTQNVCDVWMNSNVEWLNEISLDVAEKGNESNNQNNTIDDDSMVVEHTNSSIHRVECGSIESDDNWLKYCLLFLSITDGDDTASNLCCTCVVL